MKISEIAIYPSRDEDISKYSPYFDGIVGVGAFDGLLFCHRTYTDEDYLGLFNGDVLVSVLVLDIRDHGYWQIRYSQTEDAFKRRGCFRYLLTHASKKHGTVLSDELHTGEAKTEWQSLIQHTNPDIEIFVFDIVSGDKAWAKEVHPHKIWNDRERPVLLVNHTGYTVNPYREHIMKKMLENTGVDRTHHGIWYGVNSSTPDYDNP